MLFSNVFHMFYTIKHDGKVIRETQIFERNESKSGALKKISYHSTVDYEVFIRIAPLADMLAKARELLDNEDPLNAFILMILGDAEAGLVTLGSETLAEAMKLLHEKLPVLDEQYENYLVTTKMKIVPKITALDEKQNVVAVK